MLFGGFLFPFVSDQTTNGIHKHQSSNQRCISFMLCKTPNETYCPEDSAVNKRRLSPHKNNHSNNVKMIEVVEVFHYCTTRSVSAAISLPAVTLSQMRTFT